MDADLERAIALIKANQKKEGQQLLMQYLDKHPVSELGWLWLAHTLDDTKRKRQALATVLSINPDNKRAMQALDLLDPARAASERGSLALSTDVVSMPLDSGVKEMPKGGGAGRKREPKAARTVLFVFGGLGLCLFAFFAFLMLSVLTANNWFEVPDAEVGTRNVVRTEPTRFVPSDYRQVDTRELVTYTGRFAGEKVDISGQVFAIYSAEERIQLWVGWIEDGTVEKGAVSVEWHGNWDRAEFYEGDRVIVYGVVKGTVRGVNAFGGSVSQPLIQADVIEVQD